MEGGVADTPEGVTSDAPTDVTPNVPEEVPQEVPQEVPESLEAELPTEALPELQASRPRVRKIRIKDAPPPKPEPGYWNERLQEHRATQRAAKSERYANLPIM
jgi:hypothetical protein